MLSVPSIIKMQRASVRTRNPEQMQTAIRRAILLIPPGKIATYGQIAEAAGYPRYHRQVAQVLRKCGDELPWHRVLGSGGQIKCKRDGGFEQRLRLKMEGVRFRGSRVDVAQHQYVFRRKGATA
jgi:methylated-DNA-protein-cysteine methyltransferase related protein